MTTWRCPRHGIVELHPLADGSMHPISDQPDKVCLLRCTRVDDGLCPSRRTVAGPCVRAPEGTCRYCLRPMPEPLRPDVVAAAKRIKLATLALADRDARIDTSKPPRPLVDSLPALQAQFAARHDVPMRVVADMLDEVVPMLELLARVRAVVDRAKGGTAMAWLDGFAEVRDVLYPDTDVARSCNARRNMTPEQRQAELAAADAAEREAWAGVVEQPTELVDTCDECGEVLVDYAGPGATTSGKVCPACDAERLWHGPA